LRALSGRERWLLVRAGILLPLVVGLLPRAGYARTRRVLARVGRLGRPAGRELPPDAEARVGETVRMVDLATARLPVRSACLSQSLVLWSLLGAQGVASEIRFGVRAGGERLDAHAWVEVDGRPLNETPERVRAYSALQHPGV
jgi:hypothetical protein